MIGYDGGSGSADPHSAYNHSDDDARNGGSFLRKLFLILALLILFSYMAFFIFCNSSLSSQIPTFLGPGKYSGVNAKGKFREAQASAGFLNSATRLLGPRKRHDS